MDGAFQNKLIIHIVDSPYNFSIQNCPQNSDRAQVRFQSPKRCIIKHLKHTKLYSIEFLRTEMTSDPSNYHREYSPCGSYSLFQFERSDSHFCPRKLNRLQFWCLLAVVFRKHPGSAVSLRGKFKTSWWWLELLIFTTSLTERII